MEAMPYRRLYPLLLQCSEHHARVVTSKPKAVGQRHADLLLLLDVGADGFEIDAGLGVFKVDGRMEPACGRWRQRGGGIKSQGRGITERGIQSLAVMDQDGEDMPALCPHWL